MNHDVSFTHLYDGIEIINYCKVNFIILRGEKAFKKWNLEKFFE